MFALLVAIAARRANRITVLCSMIHLVYQGLARTINTICTKGLSHCRCRVYKVSTVSRGTHIAIMSSFSLPESMYEHVLRQGSQHSMPHPRSSHDGRSQFGGTIMSSYSSPRSVHEHVPRQGSQHSIPHSPSSHNGQSQFGNAILSPYSSPGSVYSEHVLRQGSQRDIPHPRSNYDGQSQFGQRSLHSDQHNPETRPAEYAYTQQSPIP